MPEVLERHLSPLTEPATTERDERAARRSLLGQVERLEGELSSLFMSTWPRKGFDVSVPARHPGARIQTLGELEQLRDDLAVRVEETRHELSHRTAVEEGYRCHIEEMLLRPEEHKWERVSNADIGEPGCKHWHVTPRFGLLGFLMNWWRVRISSGCPLAGGHAPRP